MHHSHQASSLHSKSHVSDLNCMCLKHSTGIRPCMFTRPPAGIPLASARSSHQHTPLATRPCPCLQAGSQVISSEGDQCHPHISTGPTSPAYLPVLSNRTAKPSSIRLPSSHTPSPSPLPPPHLTPPHISPTSTAHLPPSHAHIHQASSQVVSGDGDDQCHPQRSKVRRLEAATTGRHRQQVCRGTAAAAAERGQVCCRNYTSTS
jgi:hypothetical protein